MPKGLQGAGTLETWALRSTLLATSAGCSMRSAEAMVERVQRRRLWCRGEGDGRSQVLHGD